MKTKIWILCISVFLCSFPVADALAGRGGGRVGSGGAARMGGGARMGGSSFGGGARPNFSSHAPSMSRATPSINRSNFTRPSPSRPSLPGATRPTPSRPQVSRPNISQPATSRPDISRPNISRPNISRPGADRPSISRPSLGGGDRPGLGSGDRPSIGGANGPTFGGKRPNIGQLDDFLGMPGGSNRPTTLPGKVTGKRPGDIGSKLPGELPSALPGGIGKDRPNRPDGGSIKDNVKIGDTNVRDRVGNIGDRDININAGNRVNIGNRIGSNNVSSIRNKYSNNVNRPFGNSNFWDPGYSRHPNHWRWQHGWNRYPPYWGWRVGSWATVGTFFAWNWVTPTPVVYDYGSTVVYRDNYVYVDDQQVAAADVYYDQASTIAENVPETVNPDKVEWMPLGVFSISAEEATDTGLLIQLAVSKEGIIAGTFYNETTDSSRPIEGTVDRKTQRAAWKFADEKNKEVVMETVVHNLTEDESTALVHFGADKQEYWNMVRMEEPAE
ncbi:hypothetical protein [Rubripirellula reticaptiva]|uniref:Mu-protocadherin-putative cell-suface protein n=1 Tax=Rubripirellula reticaptiva TaxID=2528013 RepID=A0A5C6F5Q3_9BACT|nr:hypothetical protein [Rubripirellula reticaptiva]TWU56322.1 hypothetical protein Poly59_26260 [Rubripirellula reticaptiva]